MENLKNKLKEHHLRVTPIRLALLSLFLKSNQALSHTEIESHFNYEYDRVTLYRTLNSFVDRGLLHKISDHQTTKYALCNHQSCEHNHEDNHLHFKCISCDKLECFHQLVIPHFSLPKAYSVHNINLVIEGQCSNCNSTIVGKLL